MSHLERSCLLGGGSNLLRGALTGVPAFGWAQTGGNVPIGWLLFSNVDGLLLKPWIQPYPASLLPLHTPPLLAAGGVRGAPRGGGGTQRANQAAGRVGAAQSGQGLRPAAHPLFDRPGG